MLPTGEVGADPGFPSLQVCGFIVGVSESYMYIIMNGQEVRKSGVHVLQSFPFSHRSIF